MVDILHRVAIATPSRDDVYAALTTVEGLSGWWTRDTSEADGVLRFRFDAGGFDMNVLDAQRGERVLWETVDGPEEWIGTTISWELRDEGDYVGVMFKHAGWREPVDFMHHCSTKWATFLLSLKALVESGKGAPNPDDVKIDSWN